MVIPTQTHTITLNNNFPISRGRTNEMIGGEDPVLGSVMGVAFAKGMQRGAAAGSRYRMVNTVAKHLSSYSGPEGAGGGVVFERQTRFGNTAHMTERAWREFFLPAWRSMAVDGGVSGFMSSYQAVALDGAAVGVPDSANRLLLTGLLRGEWNRSDSYIISDAGSVAFVGPVQWKGVSIGHNYAANGSAAAVEALLAGVDLELTCCGLPVVFPTLVETIASGRADVEAAVDQALHRTLPYRFELGTLDPPGRCPYANFTAANVSTPAMIDLALEAGQQGVVLLKNSQDALPLDRASLAGKRILVTGPAANDTLVQQGGYVNMHPRFIRTPYEGLVDAFPLSSIGLVQGCSDMACLQLNRSAVQAAAAAADINIVALGTTVQFWDGYTCLASNNTAIEAEGCDRANISLAGLQQQLLETVVAAAAGRPVILLLVNAGALDVSWAVASPGVSAIVHLPFLGMTSGIAAASVLAGDYSPGDYIQAAFAFSYLSHLPPRPPIYSFQGGRLTQTWYTSRGLESIGNITDYRMHDTADYPGRTYRYTRAEVLFPFGFGLSFTSFTYSGLLVTPKEAAPCSTISVTVSVTNTGRRFGSEVVQVYLSWPHANVPAPNMALVGFSRVALDVDEMTSVTIDITPRLNSLLDGRPGADAPASPLEPIVHPGPRVVYAGGSSELAKELSVFFAVTGPATAVAECEKDGF